MNEVVDITENIRVCEETFQKAKISVKLVFAGTDIVLNIRASRGGASASENMSLTDLTDISCLETMTGLLKTVIESSGYDGVADGPAFPIQFGEGTPRPPSWFALSYLEIALIAVVTVLAAALIVMSYLWR